MKVKFPTLLVRCKPNSKKSEFLQLEEGILHVALKARAVENKANLDLIDLLARSLGLKKLQIQVFRGGKSREKEIRIFDLDEWELQRLLIAHFEEEPGRQTSLTEIQ